MFRAIFAALGVATAFAAVAAAQSGSRWREAPEYLDRFAPAGARRAAFRSYVSADPVDTIVRQLDTGVDLPGAWTPTPVAPLDAFGEAGTYDRSVVARLYGSTRPRVARGVALVNGQREFWTLISPHPDAALHRLERGTLLLVLRYDPANPPR